VYRIITVEREFGCGGGEISAELARRLGWELWDHALTEEIAKLANVDCAAVDRQDGRVDSTFHRLAKVFWRGSFQRSMPQGKTEFFDADCMVEMGQQVMAKVASAGNCVIVGRGAPYFLRQHPNAFHVFLYAPHDEKTRRLRESKRVSGNIEEMLDSVDRDRIAFVKRYFNADWPTRSLYHIMLNTAIGNDNVISTILDTMHLLERKPTTLVTGFPDQDESNK
jgi:cytidylate kinase